MVEDLALSSLSGGNEVVVEHLENIVADIGEFALDFVAVGFDLFYLSSVAF